MSPRPTSNDPRGRGWLLRPYRTSDAADLRQAAHDRTVARMTGGVPYPYTLHHARTWIRKSRHKHRQSRQHRSYTIIIDGRVAGGIDARRLGNTAELGYWLARQYRGRGIMTAVVKSMSRYVFRRWPVQRIVAKTFHFNPASSRVLVKSGFVFQAIEIHSHRKGQRWYNANVFIQYRR